MKYCLISLLAGVMAWVAAPAAAAAEPAMISPAALKADLRFAVATIEQTHPDLAHSVDRAALAQAVARIEAQMRQPLRRSEAWAVLGQLNPVLADGHLFIGLPDWRGNSLAALRQGSGFFPFEVAIDAQGDMRITAALGGGPTPHAGARIIGINGKTARQIARGLMTRVHGDTPAFRAALLSQRWWLFYKEIHGTPERFDLKIDGAAHIRVAASRQVPAMLQAEDRFDSLFGCDVRPDGSGVLRLGSFSWPDTPQFLAFSRDCFARLQQAGASRLLIDVRQNGGGDDGLWKDGILRYIADRPYRHAGRAVKRVLESNPDRGEIAGQIVDGIVPTETAPVRDDPLHFAGDVTVLIGPLTYSSAVLFSNVVQDYGFGRLAGEGGAVRSRQSGGTRNVTLPNSGLVLSIPRFVLTRPSGKATPALLTPDLPIAADAIGPDAAIDAALLAMRRP